MRRSEKINLVACNVGDTVEIYLPHHFKPEDKGPHKVQILEIKKRFGGSSPLLKIVYLETNKETYLDQSFVTNVVQRGNLPYRPKNVFRDEFTDRMVNHPAKGQLQGSLTDLVIYFLARLPYNLDRPIDDRKVRALWLKQQPGLIQDLLADRWLPGLHKGALRGLEIRVHAKPLQKWVNRNWHRFLATRQELDRQQREIDEEYSRQYWEDVEADMNREFNCELGPEDGSCYDDGDYYGADMYVD
jgi:hypothetical protein